MSMQSYEAGVASRAGSAFHSICFGPFQLVPSARLLQKDGKPVALGNRALDILIVLVEHAGEVVDQRELLSRVWRGLVVSPGNLRVHMSALRKALNDFGPGARYIANVTGQGYCFVAPIGQRDVCAPADLAVVTPLGSGNFELPPALERMVGRDGAVRAVAADLMRARFVTIVGPGGMGKTTVAIAAAHTLMAGFAGAVCFVDLGAVADPNRVVGTVAAALGLGTQISSVQLIEHIRVERMLLVFDNCEHVIDAAASLAERIFNEASGVHILATSREALRVEGESIYLLAPLDSPSPGPGLKAEVALGYPAVQLFIQRAAASGCRSKLKDKEAQIVADICCKLDGIALAIELAASQVGTHGILGTWNLLQRRAGLHWQGRRTAPPRQQTLWALLEWSYRLLTAAEQLALCRLSALNGAFTVEVAADLVTIDTLDALVAQSLLSVLTGDDGLARYRVLETTRTYVLAFSSAHH
jgi:predicted ATPase/DNA-binding winged helix-turn-helix (wHTH) protein